MNKRIHVNQHKIRSNIKNKTKDPVITVKTSKSNDYAHEVKIQGPSKIIYSPDTVSYTHLTLPTIYSV